MVVNKKIILVSINIFFFTENKKKIVQCARAVDWREMSYGLREIVHDINYVITNKFIYIYKKTNSVYSLYYVYKKKRN